MLKVRPLAKINLNLRVLGKRPDGYHLIESEVQTISLWDEMELAPSREFTMECFGEKVPCNEENLVYRAYKIFAEKYPIPGLKVRLNKKIPPGRGLGGGSSDAAAMLLALSKIFHPEIPFEELLSMARSIGADVPLFLLGGHLKISGAGEGLEALQEMEGHAVVVDPGVALSTREVYEKYDSLHREGFKFEPYENHLLPAALSLHPELEKYLKAGMKLTGSGSALFKTFPYRSEAEEFCGKISSGRKWVVDLVPFSRYRKFIFGE